MSLRPATDCSLVKRVLRSLVFFEVDWSVSGPCVECEGVKVELEKGGRWKSEVGRVKV